MVEQLPLEQVVTPAGVVGAGLLTRQIIEILKGSLVPWLDRGNVRMGVVIVAALSYVAWVAAYGQNLATDGWTAVFAFLAVSGTAVGANEAVDAGKGQVTKNVLASLRERPEIAFAAAASTVDQPADRPADTAAGIEPGPELDLLVGDGAHDAGDEAPLDPAHGPGT
jgi:hypothetical protein